MHVCMLISRENVILLAVSVAFIVQYAADWLALSVLQFDSTRVGEGRKGSSLLPKKMKGTNRGGEGGRACHVTPDLSYD